MPTETLRPTESTTSGTVLNPSNAFDGNLSTYASVQVASQGFASSLRLRGVPVYSAAVSTVELVVRREYESLDTRDSAQLFARKQNADDWTLVDENSPPEDFPSGSPATQTFDVTAIMGATPATSWEILSQFFNGPGAIPDPPDFTG